jgi:hypothetical protein
LLLLFLDAAEQQIEQVFGGRDARRQRDRAGQGHGGNRHRAAPPARTRQLGTQRLLHPTQQNRLRRTVASARIHLSARW